MNHRRFQSAFCTSFALTIVLSLSSFAGASQAAVRPIATEAVGEPSALNAAATPAATTQLHLTFALTSSKKSAIAAYVDSLTDPSSPNYHKWITPAQFGQKFGASTDDIAKVVSSLKSIGLTNVTVWPDRLFISADGSKGAAESAFGVTIQGYSRNSEKIAEGLSPTYYAPDKLPTLSGPIAARVEAVFGLSNAVQARPSGLLPSSTSLISSQGYLDPPDLANVYNISSLHSRGLEGQGQTIAIFSPTAFQQSDITRFLSANNISSASVNVINVSGSSGSGNSSLADQVEACIDIETIVGQAPAATINVYEAPNDGGFEIFQRVEQDDPNILSESYGIDEDNVNQAYASSYETIRQAMAAEGITIFVASGDSGAFDSSNHSTVTTTVDASSAYVTAVGGTELSPLKNGAWNGEVAWTYNDGTTSSGSGSSGGLSKFFSAPSWQTGPGVSNSYSNGMRQVPDVAALASAPYYDISTEGGWSGWGGTSCAAPLWAGAVSLIEQSLGSRLGNIDPKLYSIAASSSSPFHDITSGNDGLYPCTAGWDFVTGWGSVDFGKLQAAFSGTSAAAISSFTPTSGTPGTNVTLTGVNLSKASSIKFGGVAAANIISNSATQIVVQTPSGAVSSQITVTTPQGTTSTTSSFTVVSPYSLSSSPSSVSVAEGSTAGSTLHFTNGSTTAATLTLSVSGLPTGVTAAFSAATIGSTTTSVVTFSAGTNAPAGVYPITIIGTNGQGTCSTVISLTVTLKQVLTSIAVSPASASVLNGATQQLTAVAKDQFGNALATQPAFTWPTSGGGTISSAGFFTAKTIGGPYTVTAADGTLKGASSITVISAPTFTIALSPPSLNINQGASGSTTLTLTSVNGFSGGVNLTISGIPNGVTPALSANGTSAKLTFNAATTVAAGTYQIAFVGVSGSITVATNLTLTIAAHSILTSISVTRASASIAVGSTDKFTATADDQFGKPLSSQPAFTWSTSGGGSIGASTGVWSAATVGGPYTVAASSGGVSGSSTVTVTPAPTFNIAAATVSVTLKKGTTGTEALSLVAQNGFNSSASLTISGLPKGVTAAFAPASISAASGSKVTFTGTATATAGAYAVTITGTSGSISNTVTVPLTVTN